MDILCKAQTSDINLRKTLILTCYLPSDDAALQTGDRLRLNFQDGIKREKAGEYECQAQNKHGVASTTVFVNVMCK